MFIGPRPVSRQLSRCHDCLTLFFPCSCCCCYPGNIPPSVCVYLSSFSYKHKIEKEKKKLKKMFDKHFQALLLLRVAEAATLSVRFPPELAQIPPGGGNYRLDFWPAQVKVPVEMYVLLIDYIFSLPATLTGSTTAQQHSPAFRVASTYRAARNATRDQLPSSAALLERYSQCLTGLDSFTAHWFDSTLSLTLSSCRNDELFILFVYSFICSTGAANQFGYPSPESRPGDMGSADCWWRHRLQN